MKYIRNILLNFKRKLILILIGLFALFVKGKAGFSCSSCQGAKIHWCSRCSGKGNVYDCTGRERNVCSSCNGKKAFKCVHCGAKGYESCEVCGGTGKI